MLRHLDINSLFRGEVWSGETNLRFINHIRYSKPKDRDHCI